MAQDPIDRLLGLSPEDQRKALSALTPAALDIVRVKIKERKAKQAPAGPPSKTLMESRKEASKQEFESNLPQSTLLSRGREAAIGVLEPLTGQSLGRTAEAVGGTAKDLLTGNVSKGLPELWDLLKGVAQAPVMPVINIEEGIRTGDYDRAAYGAGGFLSQTAPAVAGAVESVAGPVRVGPETIDVLRNRARNIAQRATGQTAVDTSAKVFDKYSGEMKELPGKQKAATEEAATKTAEKQAAENERTLERNKKNAVAARQKNEIAQSKYQAQVKTAEEQAGEETQTQQGQYEKTQQFQLDSKRLGDMTKDLNDKLKLEADEKYQPVHDATGSDEGEPLIDQAKAAKALLKGSSENIKQFREVIRGEDTGEGFQSAEGGVFNQAAGHPLEKILEGEDPLAEKEPTKFKFADIQGYKQELDAKLGAGNLLPDVYQALKSFRDSLDAAAKTIADRNGVGDKLTEANAFYADWKRLFTDNARNKSAIGDVLNRVKKQTTDPEFYHEPFTKGKASGVAIDRLRNLKTRYSAEAASVADLAKQLRDRYNVGGKPDTYLGPRPGRVPAVDVTPPTPVGTSPSAPRTIPPVEPKEVPVPEEPSPTDIVQNRKEAIGQSGRNMQKLGSYDLRRLGLPILGGIIGSHPWAGLITGIGIEAISKGYGYALDIDKVKDFIAQPAESDIAAAQRLPEPARSNVVKGLREIIDREKSAGRAVRVSPLVQRLISQIGNISNPPKNRQEALDRLAPVR